MKIDWKRKFSSRKFWALLGGQATAIIAALGAGESVVIRVSAIIASIGTLAVYMLSEAYVDGKSAGTDIVIADSENEKSADNNPDDDLEAWAYNAIEEIKEQFNKLFPGEKCTYEESRSPKVPSAYMEDTTSDK